MERSSNEGTNSGTWIFGVCVLYDYDLFVHDHLANLG